MSYENLEKNYEGKDFRVYLTRTGAVEFRFYKPDSDIITYRCALEPVLTFLKHRVKDIDWDNIFKREKRWKYKRLEDGEVFDLLNDGRVINDDNKRV